MHKKKKINNNLELDEPIYSVYNFWKEKKGFNIPQKLICTQKIN